MGCVFVDTKLLQAHAVGAWSFQKEKKTAGGELSTSLASPASTTGQDIILGSGACGIFCGAGIFYGGGAAALSRK